MTDYQPSYLVQVPVSAIHKVLASTATIIDQADETDPYDGADVRHRLRTIRAAALEIENLLPDKEGL